MFKRIIFRVDGNESIGFGHISRTLFLAELLRNEFECIFIVQTLSEHLYKKISSVAHKIILLNIPINYLSEAIYITENYLDNNDIVILDGYSFDTDYQRAVRSKGCTLISIDDTQLFHYVSDIVINHAGFLNIEQFRKENYTTLLLGTNYALLRREFNEIAKLKARVISKVDTAFICLGGTDPDYYNQIVNCLVKRNISRIIIVVNNLAKFEYIKTIYNGIELYNNLQANEMIKLMVQSDFAILPASTLSYEYCSVSGGLFVMQTANNQKSIFNFMLQSGCAFAYNNFESILDSPNLVQRINRQIEKQKEYFNGLNEVYLQKAVFQAAFSNKIELRRATQNDLTLYFNWANDEEARNNSFSKGAISLETHTSWYNNMLKSPNSVLYVLWAESIPLGNIRFDFTDEQAILSYTIDKRFRNKGLGSIIIERGISKLADEFPNIKIVNGYVHQNNFASVNSFLKVGFTINSNSPKSFEKYNYYSLNIVR